MEKIFIYIIFLFASLNLFSQKITLSGKIFNEENGESVVGAKIAFPELATGTISNNFGFYSITISQGQYKIDISAFGLQKETLIINLTKDTSINFTLKPLSKEFEEITIQAKQSENIQSTQMGQIELQMDEIKKIPAFMGEVDLVKAIQLLPGVSSASEGGQGFYVRGGGPDQNLVLLDDAVIYNASHLFGFFSVFNSDVVKNVNLIRGGMPANYGGRLSSVLDVNMLDGNKKEYKIKGGIGIISSRLALEGPIKKDKGSFIIAGRRTYADVLMKAFIPKKSSFAGTSYYFYDLNFKANYQLSEKDNIYLSGYYGKDEFKMNNKTDKFLVSMPWNNGAATLRWTHLFGRKLFMNTSATYSHYAFSFGSSQDELSLKMTSGINDIGGKIEFSYFPNNRNTLKFGVQYTHHKFTPTSVAAQQDTVNFNTGLSQSLFGHETGIFATNDWDITENLRITTGIRHSSYTHVGSFTRYIKDNISAQDSTIQYKKGEPIAFYHGFEPRFSMRYLLPNNNSIKAGFAYNYQYIHLASISSVSLPTDIWYPTTDIAKPQKGWQSAIGYFKNFLDNQFETSVELYYKGMDNLVEFKEGSLPSDNVNDNTDNLLTFGKGWSYGIEFFIKKTRGKFTGWVGYTWAKTDRKFEALNNGKIFPAKYDRRHDLSMVGSYEINKRWLLGSAFVYATGNTLTLPNAWYIHQQNLLFHYGDRNASRMAPYHRLDLSVTWYDKETKDVVDPASNEKISIKKKFRSNWVFSVYNVYSRANPYFLYVRRYGSMKGGDFQIKVKQASLFPILPSITWNFEF